MKVLCGKTWLSPCWTDAHKDSAKGDRKSERLWKALWLEPESIDTGSPTPLTVKKALIWCLFVRLLTFSPCSSGWSRTHYVDPSWLQTHRNPPASASLLGLKACTTTHDWKVLILQTSSGLNAILVTFNYM